MTSEARPTPIEKSAPVGFQRHDHAICVDGALSAAEERCAAEGLRLTPVRRKVLELLLQKHRALGAYAILDLLREAGFGSQPPVAYRALDFLVEHGFVHKIERLNAFVACSRPGATHSPAFMICRCCDAVAEAHSAPAKGELGAAARAAGFQIERTVVEARGRLPRLHGDGAPMSLITVENLSVRYGANTVLRHVALRVEPGEIVTIVGPNGSGKTSLLRAIIGATPPADGQITLKPALKIGYVPQRLHIDPTLPMTVERFMRLTDRVERRDCATALEAAGVPDLLKRQMSQLSGGQFQRVASSAGFDQSARNPALG